MVQQLTSNFEHRQLTLHLAMTIVISVFLFCPAQLQEELPGVLQDIPSAELLDLRAGVKQGATLDGFYNNSVAHPVSNSVDDSIDFHYPARRKHSSASSVSTVQHSKEVEESCNAPPSPSEGVDRDTLSMATFFVAGVLTKLMSRFISSEQLIWVTAA